jgi:hypothetical protein
MIRHMAICNQLNGQNEEFNRTVVVAVVSIRTLSILDHSSADMEFLNFVLHLELIASCLKGTKQESHMCSYLFTSVPQLFCVGHVSFL